MLPIIMMGGAGNAAHRDALRHHGINAVSTANLFNFVGDGLSKCRSELINSGINLSPRSSYVLKIRFWWTAIIGPDMVLTHWMLHFPATMRWLAKRKLGAFRMETHTSVFVFNGVL